MREVLVKNEEFKDSAIGRIPKDWEVKTLRELSVSGISNGFFKKPELVGSGYPLVNVFDLYQDFGIDLSLVERVNATEKEQSKYAIQPGDCFFTRSSLVLSGIAHCNIIRSLPEAALFECHLMRVRPDKNKVIPEFLALWCRSSWAKKFLMSRAKQVTMTTISQPDIAPLPVPLPSKKEQEGIAEILDTVDDTIARTSSLIIKLKQTKAGLLQDLLTRGLDDDGKLRDPQAHPEQFKDSALGQIPKDWEVKPLSELADVDRGKFTHRPRNDPRFYDGSYPFIQTGDITKVTGGILTTYSQTLNKRGITVSCEFPINTIAITIAANIADTAILGIPMFFPDSVVGAVVKAPNSVRYIELCIRCAKQQLDARAPQSAQKNINLEDLRPLLIIVPEPTEQYKIAQIYEEHNTRIRTEEAYLKKLKLQKQGLMQDLLTGKVRVKNL
ncbi:restriction endonuclease subunit S [Nostoc sp.]|uniref:restriction endonuclease subunit S n=1 Tax=Nostoc sp. TaxID=1180 RepID=UPI002FF73EF8